ncbi:MAG: heavy-metal-associated domain-containing protein [Flavobacteriales bacterium]
MKTIITAALLLIWVSATAQKDIAQLDVKTSTVCDMCEKTIETELIYEKGIQKVDVHLDDAVVHVEYDTRKTTPEKIRTAISKLGYMADGIAADEAAWNKLPACCKKEGCGKPKQ